jgi:hypothetical protein
VPRCPRIRWLADRLLRLLTWLAPWLPPTRQRRRARRAASRRPRRLGPPACGRVLAGRDPAARARVRPCQRPLAADPRRADVGSGPGRAGRSALPRRPPTGLVHRHLLQPHPGRRAARRLPHWHPPRRAPALSGPHPGAHRHLPAAPVAAASRRRPRTGTCRNPGATVGHQGRTPRRRRASHRRHQLGRGFGSWPADLCLFPGGRRLATVVA